MLSFLPVIYVEHSIAQSLVDVDLFQGRANINIPIETVKNGNIEVPLALQYIATGVPVTGEPGAWGSCWYLRGSGSVLRQLKDLPDDVGSTGWLNGNSASLIESFLITNDCSPQTCFDDETDINFLRANFSNADTEPDIFYVSAPGLSCSIVFDKNHTARIIPYRDYKIEYATNSSGISSFVITNDLGIRYVFDFPDLTEKRTFAPQVSPMPYFTREYTLFQNGVQYYSKWNLRSITDASGNSVLFSYNGSLQKQENTFKEIIEGSTSSGFTKKRLYTVSVITESRNISKVSVTGGASVAFQYSNDRNTTIKLTSGRNLLLNYTTDGFLTSISENGCYTSPPYLFFYHSRDVNGASTLSSRTESQQDHWGYYNASSDSDLTPKIYVYPQRSNDRYRLNPLPGYTGTVYVLPGAERQVNPSTAMAFALNKVVNPTGGSITLEYEANNYYDPAAQSTHYGGGIRTKRTIESDGVNAVNDIIKEYTYNDPVTGNASGRVLYMPSFAFTRANTDIPGTQEFWEQSSIRSQSDLSTESTDIFYGYVTVKQSGMGKIVYEYSTPGTYWDQPTSEWTPAFVFSGRTSCKGAGALNCTQNTYPFAANTNYDFERGLEKSVTIYNENNVPVARKSYTYQRTGQPVNIQGLKFDNINGFTAYAKYNLLASVDNLVSAEKNTEYDLTDAGKFSETTTSSTYGGTSHKNVTKISVTESDGTINSTYRRYAKDFIVSGTGDSITSAIAGLQSKNINSVIETYQSVIKPGQSEKVIAGSLSTVKTVNKPGAAIMYLPSAEFRLVNTEGLSGFQPATVASQSTFQFDSRYRPVVYYEDYYKKGIATTVSTAAKKLHSFHIANNLLTPYAEIVNARHDEVLCLGFELTEEEDRTAGVTNVEFTNDARSGIYSASGGGNLVIQKSVKKGKSQHYIFSCWLKPATAGGLNITTTTTAGLARNYTLPYNPATSWTYYEMKVPVGEMTATFTLKVQPGTSILIDDVLFYPDNAQVTTYTYNILGNKLSETSTNGLSSYYEYDTYGRLICIKDQDKNIVRKESYYGYNYAPAVDAPIISDTGNMIEGDAVSFTTYYNGCLSGLSYTWNFGDGTSNVVTSEMSTSHIFVIAGTYTVTLTATHPLYGSKTTSKTITINPGPLSVQICISGAFRVDKCQRQPPLISTCGSFPSDGNNSYFNITSITGCPPGTTYTYVWQKSPDGTYWTTVGTGAGYSASVALVTQSYWIRCTVTSSCGKTGISNSVGVAAYNSTPNCKPVPDSDPK